MSYRVHEKPHKHLARRTVEATATPMRVYVTNGSTADVAFPCFYQEVKPPKPAIHHDIHYHHHVGWPVYNHPDHICQMAYKPGTCGHHGGCKTCRHYLDRSTIFPIHLSEEGYTSFGVILDEEHLFEEIEHGQISATPTIDTDQDWVVRVSFYPQIEEHFHHPQRVPFVVRATREDEFSVDTICLGELIILPAAYEATDTED